MSQSNEEINGEEILGYCKYCKREVIKGLPDSIIRRKKVYHEFCWEQEHNRPKELKFE